MIKNVCYKLLNWLNLGSSFSCNATCNLHNKYNFDTIINGGVKVSTWMMKFQMACRGFGWPLIKSRNAITGKNEQSKIVSLYQEEECFVAAAA